MNLSGMKLQPRLFRQSDSIHDMTLQRWSLLIFFNPSTPKISLVILLSVNLKILIMLVWRILALDQLIIPQGVRATCKNLITVTSDRKFGSN